MKRQGNKPEKSYIELTPGTPVWVQHWQNTTWEPATVINQCVPNSYWIMQENGTEQPKVYRYTRTMLKIRSTPTDVEQTGHMKDYSTEIRKSESRAPAIPNTVRDSVHENSLENISSDPVQSTLPRLDHPQAASESKSEDREEIAESLCTDETALETPEESGQDTSYTPGYCKLTRTILESQPAHLVIFTCKDTIASGSVDYQLKMLNFECYIYIKAILVHIFYNNCNRL